MGSGPEVWLQTRFVDPSALLTAVGSALTRGCLFVPVRIDLANAFDLRFTTTSGIAAVCGSAKVVGHEGEGTLLRFLSAPVTDVSIKLLVTDVTIELINDAARADVARADTAPPEPEPEPAPAELAKATNSRRAGTLRDAEVFANTAEQPPIQIERETSDPPIVSALVDAMFASVNAATKGIVTPASIEIGASSNPGSPNAASSNVGSNAVDATSNSTSSHASPTDIAASNDVAASPNVASQNDLAASSNPASPNAAPPNDLVAPTVPLVPLPPVLPPGVVIATGEADKDSDNAKKTDEADSSGIGAKPLPKINGNHVAAPAGTASIVSARKRTAPPRKVTRTSRVQGAMRKLSLPIQRLAAAVDPSARAREARRADERDDLDDLREGVRSHGPSRAVYFGAIAVAIVSTLITIAVIVWARGAVSDARAKASAAQRAKPSSAATPSDGATSTPPSVAGPTPSTDSQPTESGPTNPDDPTADPSELADPATPSTMTAIVPTADTRATGECVVTVTSPVRDAKVFVDGVASGGVPAKVAAPCGRQVEIAVRHLRYEDMRRKVTATDGLRLDAALERAQVELKLISDPPGAEVTYNGRRLGATPLVTKVNRFEQGMLWFRHVGMVADWRKIFPKGATSTVSITLKPHKK